MVASRKGKYKFEIGEAYSDREIVHYADGERLITSHHRTVSVFHDGNRKDIKLPQSPLLILLGSLRLLRRLLRLDKMNVVPVGDDLQDLVIIRRGTVYLWQASTKELNVRHRLNLGRNTLHQAIATVDRNEIVFGEYSSNPDRSPLSIYRSTDAGKSWNSVYKIDATIARHIHGCYWDPFDQKIWVATGDVDGECYLHVADRKFESTSFSLATTIPR